MNRLYEVEVKIDSDRDLEADSKTYYVVQSTLNTDDVKSKIRNYLKECNCELNSNEYIHILDLKLIAGNPKHIPVLI